MSEHSGRRLWFAVFLLSAVPLAAAAHSGATGIVKERMDAMKDIGRATKVVAAMFQGKQPYDAATVQTAADVIAGLAGEAMTDKFPAGSTDHPSEALPEIWRDWKQFERLAMSLRREAEQVSALAANGPAGFGKTEPFENAADAPAGPAATRMLATCKACHRQFRKDD